MRIRTAFAAAALATGGLVVPLGLTAAAAPHEQASSGRAMVALGDVAARRVEIGDTVAAAKWGTTQPIDDPAREKAVRDSAAAQAPSYGVAPAVAVSVFSDQIAANKVVQYGLFSRWTAHPDVAPRTHPDLTQVRPALDRITRELLAQLQATRGLRVQRTCRPRLRAATLQVERDRTFDELHREALERSLVSACA
jgi:chorismate mutase